MFLQSERGRDFVSHVMAQQGEAAELVPFELLHLELVSHIIHGETFCFCLVHSFFAFYSWYNVLLIK